MYGYKVFRQCQPDSRGRDLFALRMRLPNGTTFLEPDFHSRAEAACYGFDTALMCLSWGGAQ